ncbi:uncharacterized protein LOC113855821 [Abrus precatorius]|uniref:Uncharacterized protein LOC113855821 n=1 Tax=Abrus precatorius TaxID=3816 RepID=A0A8B8KHF8_ABRPR|nr:uncharacterized protein LOC113855821 [Abrus precatorius]
MPLARWYPLMEGWVKLNCDESFSDNNNQARCGGIMKDDQGRFLVSFAMQLKPFSVLFSKLMEIKQGLVITTKEGYNLLVEEFNSADTIKALLRRAHAFHDINAVVLQILELVSSFNKVIWVSILKGSNKVVDDKHKT